MIFKGFKEKSNQKYVNKLLSARKAVVDSRKIRFVGVILHADEFADFEAFRVFLKSIGIKSNKIKIIAYIEEEKGISYHWETYFGPKDFGWKGKINNIELNTFVETEFDALISFYKQEVLELDMITAESHANFKIGLSNVDQRLYDLIIDVKPSEFALFKNELQKYLTVLNKI